MGRFWNVINNVCTTVLFCCMFAMTACGQKALVTDVDPALNDLAQSSRNLSLTWIQEAEEAVELNDEMSGLLTSVRSVLSGRYLSQVPDVYLGECEPLENGNFVSAFVLWGTPDSDIYVCPKMKDHSEEFMAQVLIHESIHLTGLENECQTTELEIQVMSAANQPPVANAYVQGCGLESMAAFTVAN